MSIKSKKQKKTCQTCQYDKFKDPLCGYFSLCENCSSYSNWKKSEEPEDKAYEKYIVEKGRNKACLSCQFRKDIDKVFVEHVCIACLNSKNENGFVDYINWKEKEKGSCQTCKYEADSDVCGSCITYKNYEGKS